MEVPKILQRLEGVRETPNGWEARCPAHGDIKASLSVSVGERGRTLVHCHANCSPESVVAAAGMTMSELGPLGQSYHGSGNKSLPNREREIFATYDYRAADGQLLYQVVRCDPKDFYQRRPSLDGGWANNLAGVERVLYRLPELLAADPAATVFLPEGEKDVDALVSLDLVATCNSAGSGMWRKDFDHSLRGRHVVLLVDNDEPGRKHALAVAGSLVGSAASVKIVELPGLPPKGDVSDWLAAGGTVETLTQIVAATPEWTIGPQETPESTPSDVDEDRRPSMATQLIELASSAAVLWHTPDGDGYATIAVDDHSEHWPIRSRAFKRWLQRLFYVTTRRAANSQALLDALGTLEGKALVEGAEYPVHIRVAEHLGKVYLDLADRQWQVVEVDENGWRLVSTPPVKFRRAKAMLALPVPTHGSVDDFRQFVNVADQDWPLLITWLVAAIYPRGPYPVLSLVAEQGAGKSTVARALRRLVDPNFAPLRCEPRDPRDLMIAAVNGRVVALDNLSKLPDWLSDAICRLSTGGGFSTRTLYENDEETIFDATRPVIMTGIEDVINRGDLLDRALIVSLPVIPEDRRRPESEFWAAFEIAMPGILGGLLTGLSAAIGNLPTTKLATLPRMADFAVLATAAEPGLGLPAGAFMAAYDNNRVDANVLAIECESISRYLLELVARAPWTGTASDLLRELDLAADDATRRTRDWPKSAKALSGKIKRLAPNLRRIGIEVESWREPDKSRRRMIALRTAREISVRTVRSVRNPDLTELPSDAADAPAKLSDAWTDAERQQTLGTADALDVSDAALHDCSDDGQEEMEWSA